MGLTTCTTEIEPNTSLDRTPIVLTTLDTDTDPNSSLDAIPIGDTVTGPAVTVIGPNCSELPMPMGDMVCTDVTDTEPNCSELPMPIVLTTEVTVMLPKVSLDPIPVSDTSWS